MGVSEVGDDLTIDGYRIDLIKVPSPSKSAIATPTWGPVGPVTFGTANLVPWT